MEILIHVQILIHQPKDIHPALENMVKFAEKKISTIVYWWRWKRTRVHPEEVLEGEDEDLLSPTLSRSCQPIARQLSQKSHFLGEARSANESVSSAKPAEEAGVSPVNTVQEVANLQQGVWAEWNN